MPLGRVWLFAVWVLVLVPVRPTYQQNRNFYCQAVDTGTFNISETSRAALRSANAFTFVLGLPDALTALQNSKYTAFLSGSGFVLIIFLVIDLVVLGSLIFFAVNTCACRPKPPFQQKKVSHFWLASLIVWVIACGGMAAVVTFIKLVNNDFPTMICGLSTAGFQMINGLGTSNTQFLGFSSYATLLQSFQTDLPGIFPQINSLSNIQSAGLSTAALAATNALTNFYAKYNTSNTSNASGQLSTPFIVGNFTPGTVSAAIGSQFSLFTSVALRLDNASGTASSLTDTQTTALATALNGSVPFYQNVSAQFGVFFNYYSDNLTTVQTNMNVVFWSALVGQAAVAVIALVVVLCVMRMAFQQDCLKRTNLVRWLLFVAGFLIFCLGAAATLGLMVSLLLNTTCSFAQNILTDPVAANTAYNFNGSALIAQVLTQCAVNPLASQLSTLNAANGTQLALMEFILDGFTIYSSSYQQILAATKNSYLPAINATINSWASVYNGISFDQPGLLDTYNNFVYQNNQSTVQYVFNVANCSISNCLLIQNTTNFTPSENANNITFVSQLFGYLQNYIKSEITLINSMVADLTSSAATSPNSAILATVAKLAAVSGNVTKVQTALSSSLQTVASFRGGLLNYTNCTNLVGALKDLEFTSCFGFRTNFLVLCLLAIGTVVLAAVALWLTWAALLHVKPHGGIKYAAVDDQSMVSSREPGSGPPDNPKA